VKIELRKEKKKSNWEVTSRNTKLPSAHQQSNAYHRLKKKTALAKGLPFREIIGVMIIKINMGTLASAGESPGVHWIWGWVGPPDSVWTSDSPPDLLLFQSITWSRYWQRYSLSLFPIQHPHWTRSLLPHNLRTLFIRSVLIISFCLLFGLAYGHFQKLFPPNFYMNSLFLLPYPHPTSSNLTSFHCPNNVMGTQHITPQSSLLRIILNYTLVVDDDQGDGSRQRSFCIGF
jgi:hypothetical protein